LWSDLGAIILEEREAGSQDVDVGRRGLRMEEKGTVLIVDDSPADRTLFRTILSREGYTVFEISRGSETVARTLEVRPHVVVLDVNLPDLDGLEVCRALRENRQLADIPVLMLTVRHDDTDVLAGLQAGADDYVAKDSAPELILARVRRLVRYRQLVSLSLLNRQLVQVGRLLAGIVHEIRGPLSVIRGSAELLRLNMKPDNADLQWVDSILRGTQVLQVRLEHLMATVRSGPPQLNLLDLGPLVHEAVDLFIKGLPPSSRGIQVEANCLSGIPPVRADAGRIIQVLFDLLTNAHQAIASVRTTGSIRLRTSLEDRGDGSWVKIEVSDDGPGVPDIYLERIFEPFFSTKEEGSGYGLHLASEVLEEQGGQLTVANNPGGGACFTIWLRQEPAADPLPAPGSQ
jgi:signal transduction histidine kinase